MDSGIYRCGRDVPFVYVGKSYPVTGGWAGIYLCRAFQRTDLKFKEKWIEVY